MAPNTDIATRALIVTLKSGINDKPMKTKDLHFLLGIPERTIQSIYAKAISRGFDPAERPVKLLNEHLEDAVRTGRPTKDTDQNRLLILSKVRLDRYGREKTAAQLAGDLSNVGIEISARTVLKILKNMGFRKTKPTRKPGLTKKMREERLKWAIDHRDWTIEDWKNVIFSDETSVVIRERWKGYSEFMFWGCFSYDSKGPCHVWRAETPAERKKSEIEIEKLNEELEPIKQAEWELSNSMARLGLRNKPGPKPKWTWNKKNGRLTRETSNGGIDWWRY